MSNNNSNYNSATNSFSFPLNPVYQQNIGKLTQSHTRPSYRNPNPNHPGGEGQQHNSTGYQNRGSRPPYQPRVQPQGGAYGQSQQSYNQARGAQQQYNLNYRQGPPAVVYQQPYQHPQPGQYPQTGYQGQKPAIGYQGGYQNQGQPQLAYGQQQQPYQWQQGYQPRSNFNKRNQGSQGGDQYQNRPNQNYNQGAASFNNQGADRQQYQANRSPAREYTEEQKQERKRQNLREKKLKHTFGGNSFAQNFLFYKKNNDALVSAANSYAQQLKSDQQKQIIGEDALTTTGASGMIGPQPSPQQVTNNNYQVNFYQGAPQYQGYQAPSYSGYGPQTNPASITDASQIKSQTDSAIVKPTGAPSSGIDDYQQQNLSYLQDTFNQLQPPADRRRQNYQSGPGQGMIGPPGAQPHGYRPQYGYNQDGPQQPYQQNRYGNNPNYRGRGGMNNRRGRFMQNNRQGQRGGQNNRFQQNRYSNQHQNQYDPNNSANKDDNIDEQDYDENILIQINQIHEDEFDTVQKQQQSNVQPQNSNQQGKNSQKKPEKKAQKQLDPEEEEDLQKWIDQRRKKFPTKNRQLKVQNSCQNYKQKITMYINLNIVWNNNKPVKMLEQQTQMEVLLIKQMQFQLCDQTLKRKRSLAKLKLNLEEN